MVFVTGKPVTFTCTCDVKLSSVVTDTVVLPPSRKFTVSYGFTKSTDLPLPCKFQPAFNTSDTVAALLPTKLGFAAPFTVGFNKFAASAAVIGAAVLCLSTIGVPSTLYAFLSSSFTVGMLFLTFVIALPPLSKPSWFNVTVLPLAPVASAGFVIVMPSGVIFTALLLASLNSALVKPVNSFCKE